MPAAPAVPARGAPPAAFPSGGGQAVGPAAWHPAQPRAASPSPGPYAWPAASHLDAFPASSVLGGPAAVAGVLGDYYHGGQP